MHHRSLRAISLAVLLLLGAPVAMHFVLHDLHHAEGHDHRDAYASRSGHADHEHPVVSSSAPRLARLAGQVCIALIFEERAVVWVRAARATRGEMRHGAVRLDNDVGLQPLLSTFLI